MKTSLLRELLLYRYRYIIGYALFVIFLFGLLLTDINSVPYGVNASEMSSSVSSNSLNPLAPNAHDVINLPYHVLQKVSIGLFGLSPLAIRLPSLLLGLGASAVMALVLHQWFSRSIAMLTLLIVTASVPFISMSRTGTASILYMLLLLIIMLAAVKLTTKGQGTFVWKIVISAAGLMLFYMPLGIYAVVALLIAGILHPHVRYQIKRTRWWQFIVLILLTLALLAPLIFATVTDMDAMNVLFGIEALRDKTSLAQIGPSAMSVMKTLFSFSKPHVGETLVPFLDLTFMLFVAFGLVRTIIHRHAARSYLLIIWLAISIPLLIINPTHFALLFVPCLILMAVGLETFMKEWYRLFPRNPYARIGALIPLALIAIGMITISATRYFYGYYYTDTRATYHSGLVAIRATIKPHIPTRLVVSEQDVAFYDILRSKYPQLTVASPQVPIPRGAERIVLASAGMTVNETPTGIMTSYLTDDSVILRTYSRAR